jgi:nucleoside recognition membrane protein YjiH
VLQIKIERGKEMSLSAEQEKEPVIRSYCYMRHQAEKQHCNDIHESMDVKFKSIKENFEVLCKQKQFVKRCLLSIILIALVQLFGAIWFIASFSATTKEINKHQTSQIEELFKSIEKIKSDMYETED